MCEREGAYPLFFLIILLMKKQNSTHFLILFLAILFWGLSFVFTKSLLNELSPIAIIFFRMVISSALLVTVCSLFFRQSIRSIPKKDWIFILALSFFEPFLYFIFETYSLQMTDASIVSVIIATIPIFSVFLSVFYFKENLSLLNIIGVFVSVLGIVIMLFPEFSNTEFNKMGVLMAFGAVLSSVGYSFFLRKLSDRYHPVFIVTCQNTIGVLLFLPLFLMVHNSSEMTFQISALAHPEILTNLLLLSIFCSAVAFIFYVQAMQKLGLGKANTFTNLIPVVTAVFSYFILNETFPSYKIVGTIVVIIGICLVQHTAKIKNEHSSAH